MFLAGQYADMLPHEQIVHFALAAGASRQQRALEAEALSRDFLGAAYQAEQRRDEAIESWLETLELYKSLHDDRSQVRVLDNLGTASAMLADFNRAQEYYLRGLRLACDGGLPEQSDELSGHLLTMLFHEQRTGRDRPARRYVELADFAGEYGLNGIAATAGRILGRKAPADDQQDSWWPFDISALPVRQLNDLALQYLVADQSLRAIRIFQRMIRIRPYDPDAEDSAQLKALIYSVGDAYREIGLWEDAAPHLTQALTGYQAAGHPWMEARITYYLASIYRELGDAESAARYARLGIDAAKAAGGWEAENRGALAAALFDADQQQDACTELARSLAMVGSVKYPSQRRLRQADQLMREVAGTWGVAAHADPAETAAELSRCLSAHSAASAPEMWSDGFPGPEAVCLLHGLANLLSTPETGEERWHWKHQADPKE